MAWVVALAKQHFQTPSQTAQCDLSYELAYEQRGRLLVKSSRENPASWDAVCREGIWH